MAVRPVFYTSEKPPYVRQWIVEYTHHSGFSVSQKQKNIQAIHTAFTAAFPQKRVLEISSKSMQEGGTELSAFALKKFVPSLGCSLPVENIFQAGKVFSGGGPYPDLMQRSPRDAKRDERLRSSGRIVSFTFEGQSFPTEPKTFFYDYLYLNALLENEALAAVLLNYDAFTDIEFNPNKSLNCQARAAALFVSLHRLGLLEQVREPNSFRRLLLPAAPVKQNTKKPPASPVGQDTAAPVFHSGDRIEHTLWGVGEILEAGFILKIRFDTVGEKKLGAAWVSANCKKL
ncbi:MAG: DUF6977 family protein [Butyricicoccaceae bacterium]